MAVNAQTQERSHIQDKQGDNNVKLPSTPIAAGGLDGLRSDTGDSQILTVPLWLLVLSSSWL